MARYQMELAILENQLSKARKEHSNSLRAEERKVTQMILQILLARLLVFLFKR